MIKVASRITCHDKARNGGKFNLFGLLFFSSKGFPFFFLFSF